MTSKITLFGFVLFLSFMTRALTKDSLVLKAKVALVIGVPHVIAFVRTQVASIAMS